jgi:diguanylate cyclase (GGDEF)-like protein/PAS domain S-box-containing protein
MPGLTWAGWIAAAILVGWALWERRRSRWAEQLLAEEKNRVSELFDRLSIAHWRRDLDTGELWWSPTLRRLHGIADDVPAERERIAAMLHPEDRPHLARDLEAAYAAGGGEIHYRLYRSDGELRYFLLRTVVVTDTVQGHRQVYGINIDITDHVRLERTLRERTAYLEAIVQQLPLGLSVFDASLKLRLWNERFGQILDLPAEALREGVDFGDLTRYPAERGEYGPIPVERAIQERRALALKFEPHRFERERPDGRTHLVIGTPIRDETGQVLGFASTYTDITVQKQERAQLRQALDLLRTLVQNIPAGISMVDGDLRILYWNDRLLEMLDLPRELFERPGASLIDVYRYNAERGDYGPTADPDAMVVAMTARARRFEPHEFERTRPNGQVLHIRGQPLASGGYVTVYTDITERKAAAAEIERLARTDPLTGLYNRQAFLDVLEHEISASARDGRMLAVLFIDLDRFKSVNDRFGHEAGDAVLRETAHRLRERLRSSDWIGRLGGDEFVAALPGLDHAEAAAQTAQSLLEALAAPYATGTEGAAAEVEISPSIGIALYPQDGTRASDLLRHADLAMYQAKKTGGARWHFYTDAMDAAVQRQLALEQGLRAAIRDEQLILYAQPIHGLTPSLPLLGFELLVRWPQPDGSILAAGAFIDVIESRSELAEAMGIWVARQAKAMVETWMQTWPDRQLRASINLSARQFDRPDLAQRLCCALGCDGDSSEPQRLLERIELEVTESAIMGDPRAAKGELDRLRGLGARCAIDDFGTGYSSLAYLKQLPIDRLKIDRTFIRDLEHDPDDAAIVAAAIDLAHQLSRDTVAEGVETLQQLQMLRALGCDAVQGYLLSAPMPPDEIVRYVERVDRSEHLPLGWSG